jgi:phosphatidylglycerol:prolipoprotein diacylglycerol transferase
MYIHDNPNFTGPNGVYQPFFFYESFTNWFGLVFIYFIGELIPKKNCGDLGLGYFLWYGILRTIMNPFRYSQYAFNAGSLTFSIIWLVAAIVLIVLNHTVFPNLRKYKIWQPICNLFRKNKKEDTMRTNEQMLYYLGR